VRADPPINVKPVTRNANTNAKHSFLLHARFVFLFFFFANDRYAEVADVIGPLESTPPPPAAGTDTNRFAFPNQKPTASGDEDASASATAVSASVDGAASADAASSGAEVASAARTDAPTAAVTASKFVFGDSSSNCPEPAAAAMHDSEMGVRGDVGSGDDSGGGGGGGSAPPKKFTFGEATASPTAAPAAAAAPKLPPALVSLLAAARERAAAASAATSVVDDCGGVACAGAAGAGATDAGSLGSSPSGSGRGVAVMSHDPVLRVPAVREFGIYYGLGHDEALSALEVDVFDTVEFRKQVGAADTRHPPLPSPDT
jgi:hypothetical protein